MEQEISGLKVCRQLLLLQTLIQIRPQVVIFTGLLQRCKQWGYQTVHGTNPVTYDLPIPFEEAPFTVAISTGNSGNHASCGGFTKTTIVLRAGTTAGVWDTVGFFIIGCQLQWGMNIHGWVIFPIPFTKFRRLVTNHQGNVFMDSKARESNTLSGFTLDVADNSDQNKDAQWIAIGA